MYQQKKRQNNYYGQKQNKKKRNFVLEPGLKGFLCTCNFREKDCIKEAYNILNEYADQLYENKTKEGKESAGSPSEEHSSKEANAQDEEDIDDALSKELNNLKQDWRKPQKFQVVESGANNCLFIKTTLEDPTELAHSIMKDVFETKKQKSRFLLRLVPIEATCKAYMDEIQKCAAVLFDKYFSKEGKTFAVVFNYRNNSGISRTTIIEEFAEMIKMRNVNNKVDLSQPELTVIVEVIRNMCCLSVVPDYFKLLKYNLLELCDKGEKAKIAKAKAETVDETKEAEGDSGKTEDLTVETEAEENLQPGGEESKLKEGTQGAEGSMTKTDAEESKLKEDTQNAEGSITKTDGEESKLKGDTQNAEGNVDDEKSKLKEDAQNAEGDISDKEPPTQMPETKKPEETKEKKQDMPADTDVGHDKPRQDVGQLAGGEPAA